VIRDTGGMVGLNFATGFLNPDGAKAEDRGFDPMLRHLDHLIGRLGEDHVGFGSDFDGAQVPKAMADVAGLGAFRDALSAHGFDAPLLEKLCHGNWFGVLDSTWKA
jgi:membrane dipeptidase